MKINFDALLKDLNGEPLKEKDIVFTLKKASVEALMVIAPDDRASGEEKLKRYELAVKANGGGEVDLTPEEAAMLKERIGKVYGPVIVGPAYKLLNG